MQLILQRELRREARRPRAAVGRFVCSILGFLAAFFLLLENTGGADGRRVFDFLTLIGFGYCFVAGVRVAAGTIADEKRDGTLILLFITKLRPSEIILGKFFAVAIPLIQPFLAFIPALAITVLLGGVTAAELFRAITVIASSLLFSIAVGLCVSSFSRRNEHTGRATLSLLGILLAVPILLARGNFAFLRFFSAWTAFRGISDEHNRINPYDYTIGTIVLQYSAVTFLIAAAWFLPRRWEQTFDSGFARVRQWILAMRAKVIAYLFPEGLPRSMSQLLSREQRAEILDRNPAEWLAVRDSVSYLEQIPFVAVLVMLALAAMFASTTGRGPTPAFIAMSASVVLLLLRLASQASYPMCMMRRSGAVELLLSTPIEPLSLVTGQIVALRRQFTVPIAVVLFGALIYSMRASGGAFEGFFGFLMLAFVLTTWAVSIGALGMFIGLLEKSPASAFFQTIFFGGFVAGVFTFFSMPLPIALLFLLGFSGNRLTSPDLVNLLKRQPYTRKSALA
jgi:hypothetical protein